MGLIMAGEIQYVAPHGISSYFTMRDSNNAIWSTSGGTGGFETYSSPDYQSYAMSATEDGTSGTGHYAGNMPSAAPAGIYSIVAYKQLGVNAEEYDTILAEGDIEWNGTYVPPLSDTATSGMVGQYLPIRLTRGVMIPNFYVDLVSSADHVTPFLSGTCSGQISRDGGAFGVLQSGQFTEIGNGTYAIQSLTSGDLLANTAQLYVTAINNNGLSDPRKITFVLQRTSGQ
jgi:hypothetical protein